LCYAWSTLSRDLVSTGYVDYVDDEVGEFARVVCSEVVAAGLDEEEVGVEFVVEVREGQEVGGDVFADGGVRTTSCLDGYDALTVALKLCLVCKLACGPGLRRKSIVLSQEFAVLSGEDVVRYCCY